MWALLLGLRPLILVGVVVGPSAQTEPSRNAGPIGLDHWFHRLFTGSGPLCDQGMINSVALASGGRYVVAVGRRGRSHDGFLKLYDFGDGRERLALLWRHDNDGELETVAASHDGTMIAASDRGGTISLWRIANAGANNRRVRLERRGAVDAGARVRSLAFHPRWPLLVAGTSSGALRVFDAAQGTKTAERRVHSGAVKALAFSQDGTLLATGGSDGVVGIWGFEEMDERRRLSRGRGPITGLVFVGDDLLLATRCPERGLLESNEDLDHPTEHARLWNWRSGDLVKSAEIGGEGATSLSLSPDHALVAVGFRYPATAIRTDGVAIVSLDKDEDVVFRDRWREPCAVWAPDGAALIVFSGRCIQKWTVAWPRNPRRVWAVEWSWSDRHSHEDSTANGA